MLDLKLIRENPTAVRDNLKRRNNPELIIQFEELLLLDKKQRELKTQLDELRSSRNKTSERINQARKAGHDTKALLEQAKRLPDDIKDAEAELGAHDTKIKDLRLRIPNVLHDTVPDGKDATENVEVRTFNKKPTLKFTPKSHIDLALAKDLIDLERAAKIAGARWYFLKGKLARLEMALTQYAVDLMMKRGFTFVIPPHMMNHAAYEGVISLATFEDMMYKIDGEDLYMIATSEHPLTAQYKDEVLEEKQLPITLCGYSTNFRKEAGAHGKDQKGIFRVHQFNKVEQVVICKPEDSSDWHEKMVMALQEFFETLGLHGHVITLCSGDTGAVSSKTYDVEVWYPAQQAYREVGSCSNCQTYQSTRLNMRYQKVNGERDYVHTLNSTVVATTRALVAILENFQDEKGNIKVPTVLQKYLDFKTI